MRQSWFSRLINVLVGADLMSNLTPTTVVTLGLSHPLLYAINWSCLLAACTRVTVAEVERGTADLLLTLPISRARIYVSASVVWITAMLPLAVAPFCGLWFGQQLVPLWEPIDFGRLPPVIVNLFAMDLAIGAAAMLSGSLLTRRGPAIGIVLILLLASFLLNFLAALWPAAERLSFLGILRYYQPLPIVRTGHWPWMHLVVLTAAAVTAWTSGLFVFCRRDVPSV